MILSNSYPYKNKRIERVRFYNNCGAEFIIIIIIINYL